MHICNFYWYFVCIWAYLASSSI